MMELLPIDVLADEEVEGDAAADGGFLVSADVLRTSTASNAVSMAPAEPADDTAVNSGEDAFRPHSLPSAKRRKIGKSLQLTLLRKYVNCAKDASRVPDRLATENILNEAYDEFYFHGGNLDEPRLCYSSFLALIRNRRGEAARQTQQRGIQSSKRCRTVPAEVQEIHTLIDELERIRQGEYPQNSMNGAFDGVIDENDNDNETSSANDTGIDSQTDSVNVFQEPVDAAAIVAVPESTPAATGSTFIDGEEHVLISKRKLELISRFAQETLRTQKKLLDQVCALEQQLADVQQQQLHHHHHPLGH